MKRFFALISTAILLMFSLSVLAGAAETTDQLVSTSVEYLDNGDYIVTEVYRPAIQLYAGTNGYATATYRNSAGSSIFSVTVYGTFTYNGSTSSATSASASVNIYVSNASFVSKNAYTSGASAYGTGTVRYNDSNCSVTARVSCDKNGNLY